MKQLFVKKLLPEVRKEFLSKCVTGNIAGEVSDKRYITAMRN